MISYTEKTIRLAGRTATVEGFAVWFRTPSGLFATFEEARDHCVALEQDPDFNMAPVVVALGPDRLYEEVAR